MLRFWDMRFVNIYMIYVYIILFNKYLSIIHLSIYLSVHMVLKLGVSKPSSLRGICTKKVWVYMLVTLACIPFKVVHLGSKKGANQFAGELWNGLTC